VKILLDHLELKEIAPDNLGAGARQRL